LLAEAVGGNRSCSCSTTLSGSERRAKAWTVVEALMRYAPSDVSIVLVSRRDIPAAVCALPVGASVALLGEDSLAFTPAEGGRGARAARQGQTSTVQPRCQATGGWVTGVLFEALAIGPTTSPAWGGERTRCTGTCPRRSWRSSMPTTAIS